MPFISNLRSMEWLTVPKALDKPIKTPKVYRLFSKVPGIWFTDSGIACSVERPDEKQNCFENI